MRAEPLELLELARYAGQQAVAYIVRTRGTGRVPVASTKSSRTDVVTAIDRGSEDLIRSIIGAKRPDDAFLGEEGDVIAGSSGVRWIVDPIDGTVNFMYGLPEHAVSIAAEVDGTVEAGYVACVGSGAEYGAAISQGSWRWSSPSSDAERSMLTGPEPCALSDLLVATGFAYVAETRARQGASVARLLPQVRDIRRRGAAALDLVAVAEGNVDAYVEQGLKPWDMAAGLLICTEAGVAVSGVTGSAPSERLVVAAHPQISREFFGLVDACGF